MAVYLYIAGSLFVLGLVMMGAAELLFPDSAPGQFGKVVGKWPAPNNDPEQG